MSTSRKLFFSFLTLALFISLAEFILEHTYFKNDILKVNKNNVFVLERNKDITVDKIRYQTNSLGIRDKEINRNSDELLILCLGDSSTYGWFINENDTYPRILENILSKKMNLNCRVVNAGIPGYTTRQTLLFLKKVGINLEPDLVIMKAGHNERRLVYISERGSIQKKGLIKALHRYLKYLNIYRFFLEETRKHLSTTSPPTVPRVSANEMLKDIKDINAILKEKNIPLLFIYWDIRADAKENKTKAQKAVENGEYQKAISFLDKAANVKMNWDFELLELYATCYEKLGNKKKSDYFRKKAQKWYLRYGTFMNDEDYLERLKSIQNDNNFHMITVENDILGEHHLMDMVHPTPLFNHFLAEQIANYISDKKLIR